MIENKLICIFHVADENNYIIRKLNLDSGEIKDIFILDIEGTTEDLTQENKEIKTMSLWSSKRVVMRII